MLSKNVGRETSKPCYFGLPGLLTLEPSVTGEADEGFRVSVGAPLTADKGLGNAKPVERSG